MRANIARPLGRHSSVSPGLGLSTSREIVRRHHGEIRVESSREQGTRFTLVLPAAAETTSSVGRPEGDATNGGEEADRADGADVRL